MAKRVRFEAEPGTILTTFLGPEARLVSWTFPDSGHLEFDEDDQEPLEVLRGFAADPSHPTISETAATAPKESKTR